ncbi:MAG: rod shape-determining protein MreC, partial [Paludibacteraceae bacterium]|nr:rod shape-determining protein MreC [Paludibacteraceae bacterium]
RVLGSPMSEAENGEYVQADLAYSFIPARVIAYSNDRHHNYITLNKGRRDGITPDMGVIGKDGIVGVVQSVSTHFAVVAPIIHEGIFISSMIRKNDYMATLHWHMPDIHTASLEDVARHVDVRVGDTIVTSGMSAIFPADMPVGVVSDVSLGEGDSYYDIDVRLATDFNSLRTVTVLQYAHRAELDSIR